MHGEHCAERMAGEERGMGTSHGLDKLWMHNEIVGCMMPPILSFRLLMDAHI